MPCAFVLVSINNFYFKESMSGQCAFNHCLSMDDPSGIYLKSHTSFPLGYKGWYFKRINL